MLLNFKSLLKGCKDFVEQSDEAREYLNRTVMDRMLEEIRDYLYVNEKTLEMKTLYMKYTMEQTPVE